LLLRAGLLPAPPEELQGQDIDIEYVSPLAKAQKLTDLQSMLRGFEIMLQVSQVAPVMDYLDDDKLVQYLVEVTGMPARVIKSQDEVNRMRRQQAEQQAQAQQQAEQQQLVQTASEAVPVIEAASEAGLI